MPKLVFGKYEVIKRLAVGGMGEIFLARQVGVPGFERLVILKSLLPDLAADKQFVEAFLDEARIGANLNHPNIVSIYEVGLWEGVYFIAMEYIRGQNLAFIIRTARGAARRIPAQVAATIIRDAARALDYAHGATGLQGQPQPVVHRDISPHNIMVREDGVTKVVDFGIAKGGHHSARTRTGVLKGKIPYMAPEVLQGHLADARSDQFSLGVVFWELLTCRPLFRRDNDVQAMHQIISEKTPAPSSVLPGIPAELEAVAMQMLSSAPGDRFGGAGEVAQALDEYLSSLTGKTRTEEVARFLGNIVGAKTAEDLADLTPSGENFLISLKRVQAEVTAPQLTISAKPRRTARGGRSGWRWRSVAVAGLVLLGMAAAIASWLWRQPAGPPAGPPPIEVSTASRPEPARDGAMDVGAPESASAQAAPVLKLTSRPEKATVRAGDTILGVTPLEIRSLAPDSTHLLRLELRDHEAEAFEVKLAAGEMREMRVELRRAARPHKRLRGNTPYLAEEVRGDGWLTLNTSPWTTVTIDDAPHGSTPLFKVRLPAGRHSVRLVNEQARIDLSRELVIKAGEVSKVTWKLGAGNP